LYSGILIFLLFSGLCGGAKDIKWMIGCRGAQGVGGGLIMSTVQIVIGELLLNNQIASSSPTTDIHLFLTLLSHR
jgi:MFS family permease